MNDLGITAGPHIIIIHLVIQTDTGLYFIDRKLEKGEEGEYQGNERFEGYSLDVIDAISRIIGFTYRIDIVPDNKQGSYDTDTKEWNGLVKHLLDRVGDIYFFYSYFACIAKFK